MCRVRARVGYRGAVLLLLAMIDFVYGGTMLPGVTSVSGTYRYADTILPLPLWGAGWVAVGVVCVVQALQSRDYIAFAAAQLIKVMWATVGIAGWLTGQIPYGQLTSVIWVGAAGIVLVVSRWSEPPTMPGDR